MVRSSPQPVGDCRTVEGSPSLPGPPRGTETAEGLGCTSPRNEESRDFEERRWAQALGPSAGRGSRERPALVDHSMAVVGCSEAATYDLRAVSTATSRNAAGTASLSLPGS